MIRQFIELSLTPRIMGMGHLAKEVNDFNWKDLNNVLRIFFGYNVKDCGSFVLGL